MRAGSLDQRLAIQRLDPGQDALGQENGTWQTVAQVAARIAYLGGDEQFAGQEVVGQTWVTFSIRWSRQVRSVGSKDRILYDGRLFDIRDVREIGRREGLEIDGVARNEAPVA